MTKKNCYEPNSSRFNNEKELKHWMWCRRQVKTYLSHNPRPEHRYSFNVHTLDTAANKISHSTRDIRLTDEQYAYLLTEHLFDSEFTFNKLMEYNAPFALWLNQQMYVSQPSKPFVITCFSAECDAEDIRRPRYVDGPFGGVQEAGYVCRPELFVRGDEMMVSVYESTIGGKQGRRRDECVTDIDAKAVLRLIGGKTYQQMYKRIQERFQGATAYEDFLAFLRKNGIVESI